jgi:type II secretory pathway pseudopilin PulG
MNGLSKICFGNKSTNQRSRGFAFTIIELMISIGIFMMILLSIYSVWTGILKAAKACRTAADMAQYARISMRTIEDALTTAQMFTANMTPQKPYYSFLADNSGDEGTLAFVAHLPANFPGVGRYGDHVVRRVSFRCEPGEDGTLNLVMRQAPMLMAANNLLLLPPYDEFEPYSLVLAKDVQMFGFEMWGQEDPIRKPNEWGWVDHWKSTNSLPSLMRIGLGLGKTGKRGDVQDLVVKVVALPAQAVQPAWQSPGGIPGPPMQ